MGGSGFIALMCGTGPLDPRSRILERVTGIEPALSAWEADVLPLNYTRAPRTAHGRDRQQYA